jgi:hypothetical protein
MENCVFWHVSRYPTEVRLQNSIGNSSSLSLGKIEGFGQELRTTASDAVVSNVSLSEAQ